MALYRHLRRQVPAPRVLWVYATNFRNEGTNPLPRVKPEYLCWYWGIWLTEEPSTEQEQIRCTAVVSMELEPFCFLVRTGIQTHIATGIPALLPPLGQTNPYHLHVAIQSALTELNFTYEDVRPSQDLASLLTQQSYTSSIASGDKRILHPQKYHQEYWIILCLINWFSQGIALQNSWSLVLFSDWL